MECGSMVRVLDLYETKKSKLRKNEDIKLKQDCMRHPKRHRSDTHRVDKSPDPTPLQGDG